jgi:hypothetical protein
LLGRIKIVTTDPITVAALDTYAIMQKESEERPIDIMAVFCVSCDKPVTSELREDMLEWSCACCRKQLCLMCFEEEDTDHFFYKNGRYWFVCQECIEMTVETHVL